MINFTFNSSRAESGSITGLNESECGQIGVNSMQGTFGWTCSFLLSLDKNVNESMINSGQIHTHTEQIKKMYINIKIYENILGNYKR